MRAPGGHRPILDILKYFGKISENRKTRKDKATEVMENRRTEINR